MAQLSHSIYIDTTRLTTKARPGKRVVLNGSPTWIIRDDLFSTGIQSKKRKRVPHYVPTRKVNLPIWHRH